VPPACYRRLHRISGLELSRKHVARHLPPEQWYPAAHNDARARFIALRSERVRIVEAGPSTGVPVVLIHGWGASVYSFRSLLPLLARAGLHGVAVDLRGHGLSAKPANPADYCAPAMARHVLEIMDALGLTSVVLVGQSMGGAIAFDAMHLAADRVRAAVLVAPVGLTPIRRIAFARAVRASRWFPARVPRWAVRLLLHRVYGNLRHYQDADVEEYWAPAQDDDYCTSLLRLVDEFDWAPRPRERFEQLNGRIRVVLGQRDRLVTPGRARAWIRMLPRDHTAVVRGAGHLVAEEAPEAVLSMIVDAITATAGS
jgi:haloalkane dehalogenase